jgi:hypothetical protein
MVHPRSVRGIYHLMVLCGSEIYVGVDASPPPPARIVQRGRTDYSKGEIRRLVSYARYSRRATRSHQALGGFTLQAANAHLLGLQPYHMAISRNPKARLTDKLFRVILRCTAGRVSRSVRLTVLGVRRSNANGFRP